MTTSPCNNCINLKPNAYWHRYTHHCIIKVNGMNLRPCDMKNKTCPHQEKKGE